MHAAHEGGFVPHASGTIAHVGVSVTPVPPSGGRVPGYRPSWMQISPARHFRFPQSTPQVPTEDEHAHSPCDARGTQLQRRRAPVASHCSHVGCVRGSQVLPSRPQLFEPHAVDPPQFQ